MNHQVVPTQMILKKELANCHSSANSMIKTKDSIVIIFIIILKKIIKLSQLR